MDLFDKLGSILPFLIFALITILGNLGDKKKPKVKMKTKPFPKGQKLPDIKPPTAQGSQVPASTPIEIVPPPIPQPDLPRKHRSHHPAEYGEVHNTYQSYLEKKYQQEDLAQAETLKAVEGDTQLGQEKAKQSGKLMGLENLSLAQAILSAEILGQPRCREIILLQKKKRLVYK